MGKQYLYVSCPACTMLAGFQACRSVETGAHNQWLSEPAPSVEASAVISSVVALDALPRVPGWRIVLRRSWSLAGCRWTAP